MIIGLVLVGMIPSLSFGSTDWDRLGLKGKVKSISFGDTTFVFSEAGVLISDMGEDTLNVQYNSLHQPVLQTKGKKKIFYKYGFDGVLIKKTSCTIGKKDCLSKEFEYDGDGRLITESHCITKGDDYACPNYIKFVYDSAGRLSERNLFDSVGTEKKKIAYEYDSNGNLHEELELLFDGDKKTTLRYCEYHNDAAGNWTSRKCFENHKVFEVRRDVDYYAIPFDESNAHHDSISVVMDSSISSSSLKKEGNYPFTGGLVHGSVALAENVLVDLQSSISGLFGNVKSITREESIDDPNSHTVVSYTQELFDEKGNQTAFLSLDSVGDTLVSVRFSKSSKGFDYEISRPGNFFERGIIKLNLNAEGDWNSAGETSFIHRYDKLGRMVRRNMLRFEYNSEGAVEKIWYSDMLFDFLFFDATGKVAKILRYDCSSGNCAVIARSKVKTDSHGNVIAEKRSFTDNSQPHLIQTRIEYYE